MKMITLKPGEQIPTFTKKDLQKQRKKVQVIRTEKKIGRNDPCTCGSGKKFKKCCGR